MRENQPASGAYSHPETRTGLKAETAGGIALSGTDDVARVAGGHHQRGLKRLVHERMGGDGVYRSEKDERGWSAPLKTQVVNVTGAGDAMMASLACCWLDGCSFSAAPLVVAQDALLWRFHRNSPITLNYLTPT